MYQRTYLEAARRLGVDRLTKIVGTSLDDAEEIYALGSLRPDAAAELIAQAAGGAAVTAMTPALRRQLREVLAAEQKAGAALAIREARRGLDEDVVVRRFKFIPAEPGYEMLAFHAAGAERDDDEEWIDREAVICWRLDLLEAAAETPSEWCFKPMGLWSGSADVVLTPKGEVISLGDRLFRSYEAWVDAEREEGANRKAARQKAETREPGAAAYYLGRIK